MQLFFMGTTTPWHLRCVTHFNDGNTIDKFMNFVKKKQARLRYEKSFK